jgi:hypothetical protein
MVNADLNVGGDTNIDPLNAQLNPICHLLALLGAHHILHVSRIRVKQPRQKKEKDRYCNKVKQLNRGMVYFKIFHQNIRELGKKAIELLSHLHPDFPHVLCLTEHHLNYLQLEKLHIENYNLGAHYCRQLREKGGVAAFVHNSLKFLKY